MKVSIIGSRGYPYIYGGYETFVKELVCNNKNDNIQYVVYCHAPLFEDKPALVNNVKLYYMPAIQSKSLNQLSNSFFSLMHCLIFRTSDIILFVNTALGPFGLLAKIFGIKTAMITDGVEWKRPKWKGLGAKYFYWATKMAAKYIDVLIADSIAMKKIFYDEFKRNSKFITYGAYIKREEGREILDMYQLKENEYYLIVGRMIPDNNVDLLINGFLKADKSTKKLVIVGDAPFNDSYANAIKSIKSERLLFTGYVKNQQHLTQLYQYSFAYLHGHEYGGTNPTLLKALAYGCAIIALDTVFTREVLDNGKYGLFFQKNEESLMDAIYEAESNSESIRNYKSIARERITANYQWSKMAEEYSNLFSEMLYNNYKS